MLWLFGGISCGLWLDMILFLIFIVDILMAGILPVLLFGARVASIIAHCLIFIGFVLVVRGVTGWRNMYIIAICILTFTAVIIVLVI